MENDTQPNGKDTNPRSDENNSSAPIYDPKAFINSVETVASELKQAADPANAVKAESEHLRNPTQEVIEGETPTNRNYIKLYYLGFFIAALSGAAHSKKPSTILLITFITAFVAEYAMISYFGFYKREIGLVTPSKYSSTTNRTYYGRKAVYMGLLNLAIFTGFALLAFYYYQLGL
jgi:hypothetical protein